MPQSKKPKEDCNCYYTGFHPRFGELPKKKTKKQASASQMVNPTWNISEQEPEKPAASKSKAKPTTVKAPQGSKSQTKEKP